MNDKNDSSIVPHHSIAVGKNAMTSKPYQFVLRVDMGDGYKTFNTIMTVEEYEVIYKVLRRMFKGV